MTSSNYMQDFIKNNKLIIIPYNSLDQHSYPYYNDGTKYYKDPQGVIYRITLSQIFISRGTGNDILLPTPPFRTF